MKFFRNNDKLKEMLKQSQRDFSFDQKAVKQTVLAHAGTHQPVLLAKSYRLAWAYTFAALMLFIGLGTTLTYANTAKPGDRLYAMDTLHEQAILKLPLPAQTKAKIQANIAAERTAELNQIKITGNKVELKLKAVETSQQSLTQAVDKITENRAKFKLRGKEKSVHQMDAVLLKLEQLASEQEQKGIEIKQELSDPLDRLEIENRLEEIKKARTKAHRHLLDQEVEIEGPTKYLDSPL
ncbi:MAG: hypothetical protein A3H72_02345 [Candidatus Doudnabacteria bacterium RIFCSPLOWO2_02_FULL_48_8]|uniref:DUF5667 domain-containing protein n=1 Tax=Candidatus Doudnabacteria bacterium RIFCSPHIGHO2_01_FULL_46_24 TaxID=1817825 RepID=A0A1F5NTV8_9BACT|nr:MAG: hypothetical protein A2720_04385 [Candidatus Doudnabacteria bacterium RIFCSPHIGHO2_01_FULL_46_24]OGE95728.1 MAG: hypothetical protein A3H72_02345 [Candidatus Doudnabacteria bacterium RIFCSPLOWO2_02_FULL_48_8]OGE96159.1 MAG: hypothetical protein A3E98_03580 [Candidatus Doudnabacteria bacterium RIFCSPHIGHO2_12_FULL_48_11]